MSDEVKLGIEKFGIVDGAYCYEVDGFGNCLRMDDANVPSLLGLSYIEDNSFNHIDRTTYEVTRHKYVLNSKANPFYFVRTPEYFIEGKKVRKQEYTNEREVEMR